MFARVASCLCSVRVAVSALLLPPACIITFTGCDLQLMMEVMIMKVMIMEAMRVEVMMEVMI